MLNAYFLFLILVILTGQSIKYQVQKPKLEAAESHELACAGMWLVFMFFYLDIVYCNCNLIYAI